ncbi:MAG: transketolase [Chloroflexi bacterium]|nr:transketolase [Chloroflexota bacterium]MBV9896328.1 transketolase [Chloroflexota bacterium]
MTTTSQSLDQLAINTIRTLSIDAVQKANSGHPGLPLDAAPMAYVLWTRFLRHNPRNPKWPDRDRFVLSAGHGSMLLYSLLYLTGYDLSLDEIKNFRQWGSKTPGHPEYRLTPGVELTTGPLGQGFANGVGLAIAEAHLAATYNQAGQSVVNHRTFGIVSDGDLMEGVSYEAASIAGHLRLGKLVYLYDANQVTLAGSTGLIFTEDVGKRFDAMQWHVQHVEDGNDLDALQRAMQAGVDEADRPSLIIVHTTLGYGSPHKAGTFQAHGSPLGADEVTATKQNLGWPSTDAFYVPDEALKHFRTAVEKGAQLEHEWQQRFEAYKRAQPDLAAQFTRTHAGELPSGWDSDLPTFRAEDVKGGQMATRSAGAGVINAVAKALPELIGGSADLNPSTDTSLKDAGNFESPANLAEDRQGSIGSEWSYAGRNMFYGVREHAMGSITNGITYHGGLRAFSATFLVFSDYMRPPLRLAALSELPSIFVYTHDSIGLGEDGPTHQPIEHIPSLRAIPHMVVFRPADANEVTEGWRVAMDRREGPTILIFSRQALPIFDRSVCGAASGARKGAYVLRDSDGGTPEVILIGTGSEVSLAMAARDILAKEGRRVRVVSMPSWELFEAQPQVYRDEVLPPAVTARVAVEAASPLGWERWVGLHGDVIGLNRFGASAPYTDVYKHLNFTPEYVAERARKVLQSNGADRDGAGVPSGTFKADRASFSKAAGDDRT